MCQKKTRNKSEETRGKRKTPLFAYSDQLLAFDSSSSRTPPTCSYDNKPLSEYQILGPIADNIEQIVQDVNIDLNNFWNGDRERDMSSIHRDPTSSMN